MPGAGVARVGRSAQLSGARVQRGGSDDVYDAFYDELTHMVGHMQLQ